jgi:hypothetical protein
MPTTNEQTTVPNSSGTAPPKLKAPPNAADCHIHIYDPRFEPPVEKVAGGTAGDYRLLQRRIGVKRVVIVTPRNYATDKNKRLHPERVVGRDAAPLAGGQPAQVADDPFLHVVVEGVGVDTDELDDQRGEDRHEDQQHDDRRSDHRHLVRPQAAKEELHRRPGGDFPARAK